MEKHHHDGDWSLLFLAKGDIYIEPLCCILGLEGGKKQGFCIDLKQGGGREC